MKEKTIFHLGGFQTAGGGEHVLRYWEEDWNSISREMSWDTAITEKRQYSC